jgi:16S rRNA (guanine966-N2)-methyltransferase
MRVIAGSLKGRRLKAPTWTGLRPTSDKLRETLFNVLAADIEGARVLDGYAGTGAVGIEALSRGAAHVTFVERDPRAASLVESNLAACAVEGGYTIQRGDVASVVRQMDPDVKFDLVFLDPPYEVEDVSSTLEAVESRLSEKGRVVLERATRREPRVPVTFQRVRDVKSGDSTLTFLVPK